MKFYEATNSSTPGLRACSQLVVAAFESTPFTPVSQCTLGAGGHFGMLVLEDAAAQQTDVFFAYSRTQTPGGNGFSVEGFPIGAFSGAPADVIGLKRQAAAPVYQSNCFVGALAEGLSYQIILRDGTTNAIIGSIRSPARCMPFEMTRILDIFSVNGANAPAGDYSNVRANFSITSGGAPAMVGFCTVQENTFFGADFRIAKSTDALNNGQKAGRLHRNGQLQRRTPSVAQPEQILDVAQKNIYSMIITQPDFVSCNLVSTRLADLQMQLRQWGDPLTAPVFAAGSGFSSGGTGLTSFYVYTGARNAVNGGTASRWFIDVSFRTGGNATTPIDFGITCRSGNGVEVPWFRGTALKDF